MKIIILGDFNLNETLRYSNDYSHKSYFDELNPVFDNLGLIQLVDFITWRRLVNGVWRTSILDHVYTNDITNVESLEPIETIIGDHTLIKMFVFIKKPVEIIFQIHFMPPKLHSSFLIISD